MRGGLVRCMPRPRESRIRWARPTPQKGDKNRFGVLADSGDDGAQRSGQGFDPTHNATHAGGMDRNTTMRFPKLGTRKKISWSDDPEWCWYTACHGPNS